MVSDFVHGLAVEAEFGEGEEAVGVDPGIGAADGGFELGAEIEGVLGDAIPFEEGAAGAVAEGESGDEVEEVEGFGDFVPGITCEPFVRAFASEDNFLSVFVDTAGEHEEGSAGGIDDGGFGGLDELGVGFEDVGGAEGLDEGRGDADVFGGLIGAAEFVEDGIVDLDGVGADVGAFDVAGHGDDEAGVEAAGEVGADGDVCAEAFFDGVEEDLLEFVDELLRVGGVGKRFVALIREVEFPEGLFADDRFFAGFGAGGDLEEVTGGEEVDAFKAGDGAGHGGEGEDLIEATAVWLGGDLAGGEEAFYFGSEEEPVALPGPVEGGDAEAISGEGDLVAGLVIEGDGELATELAEDVLATFLPEVGDEFGVAVGDEVVAALEEFGALFAVVEEFSIEDNGDGVVFVGDGLLAIGEANDAETAGGEGEAGAMEEAFFVGAAVDEGASHAFDDAIWHWAASC